MGRYLASVLLVGTYLCMCAAAEPQGEELIFTNVNVVNTRSGEILHNMTVVIAKGHIQAIAKIGLIATGRDYHVVNANGKYLIPGLWDMDVRPAAPQASAWEQKALYPLFVANGVTGVRDMNGSPAQPVELDGMPSPRVMIAAEFARVRRSNLMPSISPQGSATPPSETQRSLERLNEMLLACSSEEERLRVAGRDALASHDLAAYSLAESKAQSTYDPAKAGKLFVELANRGTWEVPELIWNEAANGSDAGCDPRFGYASQQLDRIETPVKPEDPIPHVTQDSALAMVNDMRRAGLQFLSGTGAPEMHISPGFSLHKELELLVESGFTALQALQSATLNPAIFMAKLDQFGVVEKGRIADLVLLDENPLQDIRNTRKIAAVVMGGKYYSRDNLNQLLSEIAALAKDTHQYRVSSSEGPRR